MSDDPRKEALQKAVEDWRVRHNITDDDPLWATMELWKAFLECAAASDSATKYHEIRRELVEMDRLCSLFVKQGGEIIQEFRAVPKIKEELWMFPYFSLFFVAAGALATGMLIGKLFL